MSNLTNGKVELSLILVGGERLVYEVPSSTLERVINVWRKGQERDVQVLSKQNSTDGRTVRVRVEQIAGIEYRPVARF